jgi:hypothetical protein
VLEAFTFITDFLQAMTGSDAKRLLSPFGRLSKLFFSVQGLPRIAAFLASSRRLPGGCGLVGGVLVVVAAAVVVAVVVVVLCVSVCVRVCAHVFA